MSYKKLLFSLALAPLCLCSVALADDNADSCTQSCDDGKVQVSFADGNHSSCVCVDQGAPTEESVQAVSTGCSDPTDSGVCA